MEQETSLSAEIDKEETIPVPNIADAFRHTYQNNCSSDSSSILTPNTPKTSTKKQGRPTNLTKLIAEGSKQSQISSFLSPGKRKFEDCLQFPENKQRKMSGENLDPSISNLNLEKIFQKLEDMSRENAQSFKTLKEEIEASREETKKELEDLKRKLADRDIEWGKLKEKVEMIDNSTKLESVNYKNVKAKLESQDKMQELLKKNLIVCRKWVDKQNRDMRKNNIIIKGYPFSKTNLQDEVNKFLKTYFNLENATNSFKFISRNDNLPLVLVTLNSTLIKSQILREKKTIFAEQKIYIESDFSPTDQKIRQQIRLRARRERALGNTVIVKNFSMKINNDWYNWNEWTEEWQKMETPTNKQTNQPKNNQQVATSASHSGIAMDTTT